eukprot:GFYU01002955.1.p1 GENE.GFYU01002955.1~~GFYU01002955.1.p1  ORF type:complete len:571 (+),score=79.18 GFYU01002955.1:1935-3647(+)
MVTRDVGPTDKRSVDEYVDGCQCDRNLKSVGPSPAGRGLTVNAIPLMSGSNRQMIPSVSNKVSGADVRPTCSLHVGRPCHIPAKSRAEATKSAEELETIDGKTWEGWKRSRGEVQKEIEMLTKQVEKDTADIAEALHQLDTGAVVTDMELHQLLYLQSVVTNKQLQDRIGCLLHVAATVKPAADQVVDNASTQKVRCQSVLIDTGASSSFVSLRLAKLLGLRIDYNVRRSAVIGDGGTIFTVGEVRLSVEIDDHMCKDLTFQVLQRTDFTMILGMNFLEQEDPLIRFKARTLQFTESEKPIMVDILTQPQVVTKDSAAELMTLIAQKIWRQVLKQSDVRANMSTPNRPQTDGATESLNNTVKTMLLSVLGGYQARWTRYIPYVEFAYNNTKHSATKVSPFFANYGYNPRTLFDTMIPLPANFGTKVSEEAREMVDTFKEVQFKVEVALAETLDKRMVAYSKHRQNPVEYRVGDEVLIHKSRFANVKVADSTKTAEQAQSKLTNRWFGPYEVINVPSRKTVMVRFPPEMKTHPVVNTDVCRPFRRSKVYQCEEKHKLSALLIQPATLSVML